MHPRFWVIENPAGMMRHVREPREKIYLCAFGAPWKKPTHLWGEYPGPIGRPCAPHQAAPRGSRSGVQGTRSPAERARMPYGLGEDLCIRMENAL
jgi:hypothetical protein